MNVWILTKHNEPDPEAFNDFNLAFASYREHIEERTSGLDWNDEEFEWHDGIYNVRKGLRSLSCHCYGELIAELYEVEIEEE